MLARLAPAAQLWALLLLAACSSSGPVLERLEARDPPVSLRVDVLIPREVRSCAIGDVCRSSNLNQCFTLSDANGPRLAFSPDDVEFVPPDSPDIAQAPQSGCFRLVIDNETRSAIESTFNQVRQEAFQVSDGKVFLEPLYHDFQTLDAGFTRWETGIFLQPAALEEVGFPVTSRETDFVFGITGSPDLSAGYAPKVQECAGTSWLTQGVPGSSGFGGSNYTWVSSQCVTTTQLLGHLLAQTFFALRDIAHSPDLYHGKYPSCGFGDADTHAWFPKVSECSVDPDAPTCGDKAACDTSQGNVSFMRHVLAQHWPKQNFVGNHCADGEEDYDETGRDTGGVCDLLGADR